MTDAIRARQATARLQTIATLREHLAETQLRLRNAEKQQHDPLFANKLPRLRAVLAEDTAALQAAEAHHENLSKSAEGASRVDDNAETP